MVINSKLQETKSKAINAQLARNFIIALPNI